MKKFLCLFLTILLLLTLAGCAIQASRKMEEEAFKLYGLADLENNVGSDAISYVTIPWESIPSEDKEEQIAFVVSQMLGGNGNERYHSPIPNNTQLKSCLWTAGIATLDFSDNYGKLSDIDLSLADYCITLSLTQLPSISSVRIMVNGRELSYRTNQILYSHNVLLTSTEDIVRTFMATVYYLDESGKLAGEDRFINLYEGENRAQKVLDAMAEEAETEGWTPLFGEEFEVLTVRIEDGVCYLNLPSTDIDLFQDEGMHALVIRGIVKSLTSLEGIESVIIYLDGQSTDKFGTADIHGILQ